MKIIKELDRKYNPNSKKTFKERWGLFLCPACNKEVVKDYHNGIRQKTCGCQKIKHNGCIGKKSSRLLQTWYGMKDRCYGSDPKHVCWYKDKGIKVCNKWKNDFPAFRDWALKNGYQDDLQIDRIDNDGHYAPGNCQFLTPVENSRKRPNTKMSVKKVKRIRLLFKRGTNLSQTTVAACYGIAHQTMSKILNNKLWVDSGGLK